MGKSVLKKGLLMVGFISCLGFPAFGQGESDRYFEDSIQRSIQGKDETRFPFPKSSNKRVSESLTKEGRKLLKPSESDYAKFHQFLKKSKTKIAKIFPDFGCHKFLVNTNDQRCVQAAQMIGQGAYYSFRKKNNNDSEWFDIYFAEGKFAVIKASGTLGFWMDLGDVPIEDLEKNSLKLSDLKNYQLPQTKSALATEQAHFESKNQALTARIKIQQNRTYGLRLAYWTNRYYGGEDIDVLIVLRIIGENEDGSVTFIWRELQRKRTPKLK